MVSNINSSVMLKKFSYGLTEFKIFLSSTIVWFILKIGQTHANVFMGWTGHYAMVGAFGWKKLIRTQTENLEKFSAWLPKGILNNPLLKHFVCHKTSLRGLGNTLSNTHVCDWVDIDIISCHWHKFTCNQNLLFSSYIGHFGRGLISPSNLKTLGTLLEG